jgi:RNA polymerase sigma-70 factor (ECF subfamily)
MTAEELIEKAQRGDRPALTRLLLDHRELVAAVVSRFVSDPEQRKDVIQNIFISVISHIGRFAGLSRFSTWLYRLSINECIEHCRKICRSRQHSETLSHNSSGFIALNAPDPLAAATSAELRGTLSAILATLPLDQKTAFSLFYFGSYTGREGAEAMSISEANFFMKLKSARDAVKQKLTEKGWAA